MSRYVTIRGRGNDFRAIDLDDPSWAWWLARHPPPEPCRACGRPVISATSRPFKQVACSLECLWRLQREDAAAAARARRRLAPRVCPGCGGEFQPRRKDAVYCSGRCRTAAHRARSSA